MRFFTFITEVVGWLQIAASPTFIGLVAGIASYYFILGPVGFIAGIVLLAAGVIIGAVWATREWKKKGTIHFMSKIMSTPELDENEKGQS